MIFFKAIALGFTIGAVVGPIGILCIKRSISQGFIIGLATGIGAALADAFYAGIAAFGLSMIASWLIDYDLYFRFIGGIYLLYLGYQAYATKPNPSTNHLPTANAILPAIGSTFFLTMINPTTICSFAILFANVQFDISNPSSSLLITGGVFLGSTLWWIILSGLGAGLAQQFDTAIIDIINKVAGIVIGSFGIVTLGSLLLRCIM